MSSHYEIKKPLSADLIEKIVKRIGEVLANRGMDGDELMTFRVSDWF